jgi:hypothetical protein
MDLASALKVEKERASAVNVNAAAAVSAGREAAMARGRTQRDKGEAS